MIRWQVPRIPLRCSLPVPDFVPDLALLSDKRHCSQARLRERVVVELAVLQRQLVRKLLRLKGCAVLVQVSNLGGEMIADKTAADWGQIKQGLDHAVE